MPLATRRTRPHSVRRIEESRKVRADEAKHGLRVIGALYHTDTGEVEFLD